MWGALVCAAICALVQRPSASTGSNELGRRVEQHTIRQARMQCFVTFLSFLWLAVYFMSIFFP